MFASVQFLVIEVPFGSVGLTKFKVGFIVSKIIVLVSVWFVFPAVSFAVALR